MRLDPARHMFDEASLDTANTVQQGQQSVATPQAQTVSSAVFAGGMLGITNNVDSSQAPPSDTAQGIIRHLIVQVATKDRGQPVPYLNVTLDVLLDGHPVFYDLPLAPMVAVDRTPPQFYYGNNVKFPQRGTYQVFVRLQRNPMLGKDQPPAAQFNVNLR